MLGGENWLDMCANVAILAGNSRVSLGDDTLCVQPQLAAFRAGLVRAKEISGGNTPLPDIAVAFDHCGVFRKQFLRSGLTNSQQRHPVLSQLRGELIDVFEPIAIEIGIPLSKILVVHEDSARTHASHLIRQGNLPHSLIQFMRAGDENDSEVSTPDEAGNVRGCSLNRGPNGSERVTCAAVTAEYFSSSLSRRANKLEVYYEDDPWSQSSVYVRGAVLLSALGNSARIELHLIDKCLPVTRRLPE
jgi:hypothetical protein